MPMSTNQTPSPFCHHQLQIPGLLLLCLIKKAIKQESNSITRSKKFNLVCDLFSTVPPKNPLRTFMPHFNSM
ncbi:hypothetical protein B9Z55_022945 [Caenorhabditis nigoni]|uniref:Uncharacterized protein n=1 Tax=Caenorhabditis nigoni TaxID=1611254 RepID=A0A2G5SMJ5_9PELO|nr:hypothetical protein B9Z55_022945 [Caenorhabditis nigoni]